MGVAVYYRFTTELRASAEIGRQERAVSEYCARHGLGIDAVFQEIGYRSNTYLGRRPEGARLLEACAAGEVDTVVFCEPDSLAGGTLFLTHALALLLEQGIDLRFVRRDHQIDELIAQTRAGLPEHAQKAREVVAAGREHPPGFHIDFFGESGFGEGTLVEPPSARELATRLGRQPTRDEFVAYILSLSQAAHNLEEHALYVQWLACTGVCDARFHIYGGMWPHLETGRPRLFITTEFMGEPEDAQLWEEVARFAQRFDARFEVWEDDGPDGEPIKEAQVEWQVYGWRVDELDQFLDTVAAAIEASDYLAGAWLESDIGLDDEGVTDEEETKMSEWTPDMVLKMAQNPAYAVKLDERLFFDAGDQMIPREQWIAANVRLIEEVGAAKWLDSLLEVLEGKFPEGQEPDLPFGYTR